MKRKISIVTINYNNLAGLKKTRESISAQTYEEYEWIVIDGGSTDGAKEFLQEHSEEMVYWCSEKDKGVYNAQNKGIALAKGDYVICMNSGDCFHDKDVLQNVFKENHSEDVLYGDWMRVYPDGNIEKKEAPQKMTPYFFYYDNICHQAMFIKTSVMQNSPFDETYKIYADWSKWRELYQNGCSFCYVPVVVCDYLAGIGLSEIIGDQNGIELKRLEDCLPEGIQMIRKSMMDDLNRLRETVNEEREKLWKSQADYTNLSSETEEIRCQLQLCAEKLRHEQSIVEQQGNLINKIQPVYDNKYALLTYKLVVHKELFRKLISLNLKFLKLFTKSIR